MNQENGFTLVEGLLIVLIVLFVGFAGYTVLSNNRDDSAESETKLTQSDSAQTSDTPEENANEENIEEKESELQSKYETENWAEVNSGQRGFSVNIPNGWSVTNVLDSDWVYSRSAEDTNYDKGVGSATVNVVESTGFGGPSRFTILHSGNANFLDGDEEKLGSFSAENVEGYKYYKKYPEKVGQGIGPLPGQESYTYVFTGIGIGSKTTYVSYNIQKGEANDIELVDAIVSTLFVDEEN